MDSFTMNWTWRSIVAHVAALYVAWNVCDWLFSPLRSIPGPLLASFTRLWHVFFILKGDQNVELTKLHEKHGPFVRIAPTEISVSHRDAIKKILLTPLHKGTWYRAAALPYYRFQTPMSTIDPSEKNERSRHFASGYKLGNLLQNEEAIDNTIRLFLHRLDSYAKSGKAFDLDKYISFLAFDVLGEILFSKQFGFLEHDRDIGDAIRNGPYLSGFVSVLGYFRWLHVGFLGNPVMTWLGILPMGHIYDTSMTALAEREKNPNSRYDVLAHWFAAVEKDPRAFTLHDICANTSAAVGAGSETAGCAMQSFVYHMLRHPNALERVRAEMDEAMVKEGLCQDTVISFADTQKLPFFQICVKEAIRVFAPVPMGLPRVAPRGGLEIGDEHFPAGTTVSVNPWVMHHNKEIWGEDALEFNPDRWLKDDAEKLEKYFMPWGYGHNSCPGQNMARMEISKVAATLVRDYDFCQEHEGQDWKFKAFFTMVPYGWPVHVRKRVDP